MCGNGAKCTRRAGYYNDECGCSGPDCIIKIEGSPTGTQILLGGGGSHPCPQGRYTQSSVIKLVVSYKSCMKPRLTQIQGDSNLFTDFFLR